MNKEELFYSEAARRTQEQYQSRQHFDTMTTAILGFGGLIASSMVITVDNWSQWSVIPAIIVLVSFLILAIATIVSLLVRTWQFQPALKSLQSNIESKEYNDSALIEWSAKYMSEAIEHNEKLLRFKTYCLRISYIILAIEVLSLGLLIWSTVI